MQPTRISRRLDHQGRIIIPSRLRESMGFVEGDEYFFYKHREGGSFFLCIECPGPKLEDLQVEDAMRFLRDRGFTVTKDSVETRAQVDEEGHIYTEDDSWD